VRGGSLRHPNYLRCIPRSPRLQAAGAAYHVTSRGVARQAIFRDDKDRLQFLKLLDDIVARFEWSCHAFVLMTTHYHLLVRTPNPDLARGMQRLNACYAQHFNRRHGETGHRFERRYQSVLVESDAHALELIRYLALNPVRAGACRDAAAWPWSSYAAIVRGQRRPYCIAEEWLLTYFGRNRARALERLQSFVEDMSPKPPLVKGSDPG
jgi:REP-associated tyrosine transposase